MPDVSGSPQIPSPIPSRLQSEQSELSRLQSTGSGVEQYQHKHPILGTIARIGDAALSSVFPAIAMNVPGTTLHHQALLDNERGAVDNDLAAKEKEAQTANLENQPELNAVKLDLAKNKLDETSEKNKNQNITNLRKYGLTIGPEGQPIPLSYAELSPEEQAVHDLKQSQEEANDARAELDKNKSDPNSPVYQMQARRLKIAEQNSANAATRLGLSQAQFENKLSEQSLVKPSGQSQSRGSAAQSALDVMPELLSQVKANAKEMGPIMGRINHGELAIGDAPPNVARLYAAMKSMYALQPAVHGFRSAEFVKDLETAIGTMERNPAAFVAGMEGLKPTLEAVAKEGKTFHQRIVEPPAGATPTATPAATPTATPAGATPPSAADPGMKWQHRTGADKKIEWRQVKQ